MTADMTRMESSAQVPRHRHRRVWSISVRCGDCSSTGCPTMLLNRSISLEHRGQSPHQLLSEVLRIWQGSRLHCSVETIHRTRTLCRIPFGRVDTGQNKDRVYVDKGRIVSKRSHRNPWQIVRWTLITMRSPFGNIASRISA
jgi:hypothetical protein